MSDETEKTEKTEKASPKRTSHQISVKTIRTEAKSALVEWVRDGVVKRAYVPRDEIKEGTCSESVLAVGIPYGIPWAKLIQPTFDPELLEAELHRRGIWNVDDLRTHGQHVLGAINRATGINLSTLRKVALEYLNTKGN